MGKVGSYLFSLKMASWFSLFLLIDVFSSVSTEGIFVSASAGMTFGRSSREPKYKIVFHSASSPFHPDNEQESLVMADKEGQSYICFLPIVEETKHFKPVAQPNSTSLILETDWKIKQKTPDELIEGIKEECIYRHEGWWSYEFCHQKHVRQLHLEDDKNIFTAGTETSTNLLIWTISELMKNPRVMKKAQEEVRQLVGSNGKVEAKDIHHLHYIKLILKEILRLHTPAPLLVPREVLNGFKVDGYDIEPKTRVIINAWAICRDEKYWDRPREFWPERFMNSSIDIKGHDFQLLPFGAGSRICPGMNIAMTFVEIVLANLLYAFHWDFLPGMTQEDLDMEEISRLATKKKNPLILMASRYDSIVA